MSAIDWPNIISQYRFDLGLKQEACALDLGVSQSTLSRWESGATVPPTAVQAKILEKLRNGRLSAIPRYWSSAVKRLQAPTAIVGENGGILAVSAGAAQVVGLPAEACEGAIVDTFFDGEMVEDFKTAQLENFFSGSVLTLERCCNFRINSQIKKGVEFYFHTIAWPVLADDGKIYYFEQGQIVDRMRAREIKTELKGRISMEHI